MTVSITTAALITIFGLLQVDASANRSDCQDLGSGNKAATPNLPDVRDILDRASGCPPLGEGSSRVYSGAPAGLEANYTLTRLRRSSGEPRAFQVTLNLNFVDNTGFNISATDFQSRYRSHMQRCFNHANSRLRGPNGESFTLQLYSDNPGVPRPPRVDVTIGGAVRRDTSHIWDDGIDCETTIHEVMHLLGLVDEYHETMEGVYVSPQGTANWTDQNATHPAYDCRIIGPDDSLMSHQSRAFDATQSERHRRVCQCFDGARIVRELTPACRASLAQVHPGDQSCPQGTRLKILNSRFYRENQSVAPPPLHPLHDYEALLDESFTTAQRDSLLYPAQFRAITEPGCEAANHRYYQCARLAYFTSDSVHAILRRNSGYATFTGPCPNLPACAASGSDQWLR